MSKIHIVYGSATHSSFPTTTHRHSLCGCSIYHTPLSFWGLPPSPIPWEARHFNTSSHLWYSGIEVIKKRDLLTGFASPGICILSAAHCTLLGYFMQSLSPFPAAQ